MKKTAAMNPQFNQTASGTLTGTALALLMQVSNAELLKTVVMAATGAVVSFLVSYSIKTMLKWIKKR